MAEHAISVMNGHSLGESRELIVFPAQRDKTRGEKNKPSRTIWIGNVPEEIGVEKVISLCSCYGTVLSVVPALERDWLLPGETKESTGQRWIVTMQEIEMARTLLYHLNSRVLHGQTQPFDVSFAESYRQRRMRYRRRHLPLSSSPSRGVGTASDDHHQC